MDNNGGTGRFAGAAGQLCFVPIGQSVALVKLSQGVSKSGEGTLSGNARNNLIDRKGCHGWWRHVQFVQPG